jgi:transposase
LRSLRKGPRKILVLDGAEWHGSKDLVVPHNSTLMLLPLYSLELNPVENNWHFLRQNHLMNCVFRTYNAIVDVCCAAWGALIAILDAVISINSRG